MHFIEQTFALATGMRMALPAKSRLPVVNRAGRQWRIPAIQPARK